MKVPFVDLYAQYVNIQQEIDDAISKVIADTSFIGGEDVKLFEKEFASYMGAQFCVACANGTDSIEMALKAMGVGPGDEVIVPAISWISTSEAVSTVGARPIFVDVEKDYLTIDVSKIEEKITTNTKAIIPVHLYGHPANMSEVMRIAKNYDLKVLEDCAQAHNAEWNGQKVGNIGNAGSFSFYPGKNLGAYGDAGGIITNDEALAKKVRMIANHGQLKKHDHQIEGRNSRMDGMQAAILRAKLPHLSAWTDGRIAVSDKYDRAITNTKIVKPKTDEVAKHVFHLYVIRTEKRDELKNLLESKNISVAIHYPTALPFMPCYSHFNFEFKDFPVAAENQNEILSIPMYAEMTDEMIQTVAEELNNF
ncbi:erythromycin biosynthesis sensory transduction protein eryC1 [Nonlabens spongiae]|uniref:Erythromycin biosynthesis sensory transduction protein eryC1 n=1 Tax=Nonlabens spongiae TaxID=331648 RepID=A0A1W6MFZ0_9FLAO|nr:DegT/DnrJ/EryC1/StrS family aminotransferase [Nonlabens spongiae]ARN76521.1 erythromycin biosynthesis sensory transduction protein eryC1 [Nonlabens spongiae]